MNNRFHSDETYITLNSKEKFWGSLRWKLGLGTQPCIRTRIGKRCTFCGFKDLESPLPADKVSEVFQQILEHHSTEQVNRLELYVSGSFFDEVEVSPKSRQAILRTFSQSNIEEILIESRPEFIKVNHLNSLAEMIAPHRVTVGIGVETMDDKTRKPLLKGTTTKKIAQSIDLITKAGMNVQAYLLLKPPHLNSDREAITRFMRDIQTLMALTEGQPGTLIIAVQPTFVANNTVLTHSFSNGSFRPIWLYSIALVLKELANLRIGGKPVRIILGNENDNVEVLALPANYTHPTLYQICSCSQEIRQLLHQVNESEETFRKVVNQILDTSCRCKDLWQKEIAGFR